MGLLDIFKKNKNSETPDNHSNTIKNSVNNTNKNDKLDDINIHTNTTTSTSVNNTSVDDEKQMLDRLCSNAGNTIAMLKNTLSGPKGCDLYIVTIYAAGLAGIACHEAVKAQHKGINVIETKDGKKYYMGDELNKYLHENKYSVTGMVRAVTKSSEEMLMSIVSRQANTLGSDQFVVNGNMDPADLYKNIKACWDGIFNNMTAQYCKTPDEWPIFFGIVLQNIVAESMKVASADAIFNTAVDICCALSKMDKESL